MEIGDAVQKQHDYFAKGETRNDKFRKNALNRLYASILTHEKEIYAALQQDLNKSEFESYLSEVGFILGELRFAIKHLCEWMRKKYVRTPLTQFPAASFRVPEPYGVVLIIAPWNYPFQLSLGPLIGALAAGNCVVIKPSDDAPATALILKKLIQSCFSPEYVTVISGGIKESKELLENKFDYVFFTGSVAVGKLVMESAARYLTPVTLELGGKSPCIVDQSANIPLAAKRIVFGKYLNAGQTCVAPDYLLVHESKKDELLHAIKMSIANLYGNQPLQNSDYPKIINQKHFKRLLGLMEGEHIYCGGTIKDNAWIAPTVLDGVTAKSLCMQEEIFGPILPVLSFCKLREAISFVNNREKPLALYLFTTDRHVQECVLSKCSFGGGCVNDTIMHLATPYLGFGGVGQSGMGDYHGKKSFDTFSHTKSIIKKANFIDIPLRYPPYTKKKMKWLKRFW